MIHYIRFRNYYSFGIDEDNRWAEIDFRLPDEAPENRFTFLTPSGLRLNRVLAVIGPNASGKTNLIRAISFLNFFMFRSHAGLEPDEEIPIKSHIFEENDIIQFEMKFELQNGDMFLYCLDVTPKRIVRETLNRVEQTGENTEHLLFDRVWNKNDKKYDFNVSENLGFYPTENLPLRDNVSTLSTARQNAGSLLKSIEKSLYRGVNNVRWDGRSTMQSRSLTTITLNLLKRKPDLFQAFNKMLGCLDLGLTRFEIVEEEVFTEDGKKRKESVPVAFHTFSGEEKELDFFDESGGTKALFVAFPRILEALSNGGISTWDEIEGDLHPDVVQAIVRLFLQPETNPHNAQIVFSSHNHEVLRLLTPSQLILLEKEDEVFSVARRLDTIEGVTEDDNLYARYRARAYGGKPNINLNAAVVRFLTEVKFGPIL